MSLPQKKDKNFIYQTKLIKDFYGLKLSPWGGRRGGGEGGRKKENEGKCMSKNMVSFGSKEAVCCSRFDAKEVGSNFIILLYDLGHHCLVNKTGTIMHALSSGIRTHATASSSSSECLLLK